MKKHLLIIISLFLFAASSNAANNTAFVAEHSLSTTQNNLWDYVRSIRLTRGEMSRIGGAMIHSGHRKFFESPITQNAITYLSLIIPIGEGVGLLSNIIRTGAQLIVKQGVKIAAKNGDKSFFKGAKYSKNGEN
jgi:hypothetical protein